MDNPTETAGIAPPPISPREPLITTAVNFLKNPNVANSPVNQKQQFLRSKGLTEEEIQIACDRSGVFTGDPNKNANQTIVNLGAYPTTSYVVQPKQTLIAKIRDILSSVALFGGIVYSIYLFYKRFIEPFLFGRKKKKNVEEIVNEMDVKVEKNIQEINQEISRVREEIKRTSLANSITTELQNFKSDLDAIKGLLLNRKQFANPSLPVVPPSIPAWQLTAKCDEQDKNDDNDTGSGSSETEVVTKNSDSSLEIISGTFRENYG